MPNIGPLEMGIILLIVLLIFGPKRLPGLGRQLGSGMREFKDSVTGRDKDDDDDRDTRRSERALARAEAPEPTVTPAGATPEPEVVTGDARPQDQPRAGS
jgi:sec-independent protein translocase protein TatA